MIWKTETHEFIATVCQRTGKTCPALARMARAMAQAMTTAGPVATREFEIEGSSELTHCPDGCTARFRAGPDQIRFFCGSDMSVETNALDEYADMMFGSANTALPSSILSSPPYALLEANALVPRQNVDISQHAAA